MNFSIRDYILSFGFSDHANDIIIYATGIYTGIFIVFVLLAGIKTLGLED